MLRLRAENERLRGEVADLRMHQDSMAELISRQVLSLAQRDAVIAETSQRLQKAEAVCEAAERYRISIDNQRGWTSPAELDAALAAWREGING